MDSEVIPMEVLDEVLAVVETGSRPTGGSDSGRFGLPSLGGENLKLDGTLDLRDVRCIRSTYFYSMRTGHLRPKDVLINKDGAQTGKVARYLGEFHLAAINEHLFLLRGTSEICQDYLFHVLLLQETQRMIQTLISGSAQPGLNRSFLKAIRIPLPSLEEQSQIAEILDTIDHIIRSTERVIAKLERLRSGVSADFLSRMTERMVSDTAIDNTVAAEPTGDSSDSTAEEPRGYVTLAELADLNPESLGPWTPSDQTFKYIDISSVSHGSIDEISIETLRFADAPSRARRVVKSGDVLFGTVRPGLRSHARVVDDGYVASTGFCVTRPRPGVADSGFLGHFLLSDQAAQQALQREVGSNYPAVTERDVAAFRLPRLPLEQQRQIASILDAIDEMIRTNRAQLDKHRELRAGLTSDLLSGRVRTVAA